MHTLSPLPNTPTIAWKHNGFSVSVSPMADGRLHVSTQRTQLIGDVSCNHTLASVSTSNRSLAKTVQRYVDIAARLDTLCVAGWHLQTTTKQFHSSNGPYERHFAQLIEPQTAIIVLEWMCFDIFSLKRALLQRLPDTPGQWREQHPHKIAWNSWRTTKTHATQQLRQERAQALLGDLDTLITYPEPDSIYRRVLMRYPDVTGSDIITIAEGAEALLADGRATDQASAIDMMVKRHDATSVALATL